MKKVLLFAAFAAFGLTSMQAQEGGFKIGVNAALPVGDMGDFSSFGATLDIAYLFDVVDSFQVGPTVGYQHFFGKTESFEGFEIEYDDLQFLPIAAAARFYASESFFFGADLGYAVGITDGVDGGIYYKPKVGYNVSNIAIVLSYSGISVSDKTTTIGDFEVTSEGGTYSAVQLGIEFGF